MKNILLLFLFFSLLACSTITELNKQSEQVKSLKISPMTCTELEKIEYFSAEKALQEEIYNRNYAAKLGGTHIFVEKENVHIFLCNPPYVDYPEKKLSLLCNKNDAKACLELSNKKLSQNKYYESLSAAKKACELGLERSCNRVVYIGFEIKKINCLDKNEASQCLSVALDFLKHNFIDETIYYSNLACIHGSTKGCKLNKSIIEHNNMVLEQNSRQLQNQILIDQNKRESMRELTNSLDNFAKSFQTNNKVQSNTHKQVNCNSKPVKDVWGDISYQTDCEEN